jgi:hypothetical protein
LLDSNINCNLSLLLLNGPGVTAKDKDVETPVHCAISSAFVKILKSSKMKPILILEKK